MLDIRFSIVYSCLQIGGQGLLMVGRETVVLSTRVDKTDRDRLAAQAEAKGVSLAEYVRKILQREARGELELDQLARLERKIDVILTMSTMSTPSFWRRLLTVFRRKQGKVEISRGLEIDSEQG